MKFKVKKLILFSFAAFVAVMMFNACGSSENKESKEKEDESSSSMLKEAETMKDDGKGIGPVKELTIATNIDDNMAANGQKLFEAKCTACHKWQKEKYVGPGLMGVTERRKPEWIMNQILNPTEMTQRDPTAKALLAQYMTQMTNQNCTQDDARAIFEYFRKMDSQKVTASM